MSSEQAQKASRLFRLPEGGVTEDMKAYVRAWSDIGDFLEAAFKGYKVFGYDPDFVMSHPDMQYGSHGRSGFLTLSVHAALALKQGVEEALDTKKTKHRNRGRT